MYVWQDGHRDQVTVPRTILDAPRMKHDLHHEGASFRLQDWKVRYGADGVRETVLVYSERASPSASDGSSGTTLST